MKKLLFTAFVFMTTTFSCFADSSFFNFSNAFKDIRDEVQAFLPENSTMLSIQPDAFIGHFFPARPPRFTAGITAGGTLIDTEFFADDIETMINDIISIIPDDYSPSLKFSVPEKVFLPTVSAAFRIGGIILPFDVGFFGVTTTENLINDIKFDDFSLDASYSCVGTDFRFAVIEGDAIMPKLSVGAGYIYSNYKFNLDLDKTLYSNEYLFAKVNGNINMNLECHTVFTQLQVSKKLLFFTPSLGVKAFANIFNSNLDWNVRTSNTYADIGKGDSYNTANDLSKLNFQTFAGLGFQVWHLQVAAGAAYNFTNNKFSCSATINYKM